MYFPGFLLLFTRALSWLTELLEGSIFGFRSYITEPLENDIILLTSVIPMHLIKNKNVQPQTKRTQRPVILNSRSGISHISISLETVPGLYIWGPRVPLTLPDLFSLVLSACLEKSHIFESLRSDPSTPPPAPSYREILGLCLLSVPQSCPTLRVVYFCP